MAQDCFAHHAAAGVAGTEKQHIQLLHGSPWQQSTRVQRQQATAMALPTRGASKYSQSVPTWPETSAGASERAGFIDAPQIGPANIASRATTAPIAVPAMIPFSCAPVETLS